VLKPHYQFYGDLQSTIDPAIFGHRDRREDPAFEDPTEAATEEPGCGGEAALQRPQAIQHAEAVVSLAIVTWISRTDTG
jgi:hypothetical protein